MRPFHAAAPFLAALMLAFAAAAPALAQDDTVAPPSQAAQPVTVSPAEGNWGCIALVDNSRAGHLGYVPQDNTERFRASVEAEKPPVDPKAPSTLYLGGWFVDIGHPNDEASK